MSVYHKTITVSLENVDAGVDAALAMLRREHGVDLELDCCSLLRLTNEPEPRLVVLVVAKVLTTK